MVLLGVVGRKSSLMVMNFKNFGGGGAKEKRKGGWSAFML